MLRSKQILHELSPSAQFAFSEGFTGFKKSERRRTNTSQRQPEDKLSLIQEFHRSIRAKSLKGDVVGPLGKWTESRIANMDQTPLPFCFSDGSTYDDTGNKSVWVRTGCTVWTGQTAMYSSVDCFCRR